MIKEEQLLSLVKSMVSAKKYIHILGVRDEASKLADFYNIHQDNIRIAAILHDATRNLDIEEQKQKIKNYFGIEILKELPKGALHDYTGYLFAKDELNISNEEILNSIKNHTLGRPEMSIFEKIIFLADFFEPSRENAEASKVKEIAYENIDKAVLYALDFNIKYNEEMNNYIPKISYVTLEYYRGLVNEHRENN